jgi:hypothetical protein
VDVLPAIRVEYDAGARNSRRDSGAGVGRHPETRAARG